MPYHSSLKCSYLELIYYYGVISSFMVIPTFFSELIIRTIIGILCFNIWFLLHAVEIFMQTIQQKCKQLL